MARHKTQTPPGNLAAASSSGEYTAPHDGDLVDVAALDGLPDFDDALIPEALGILGFDMPSNGMPSDNFGLDNVGVDADQNIATNNDEEDYDAEDAKKKLKVPGGNQRAVQKRYRERKKNYTKDLENKVEKLQSQLKQMQSAAEQKHEDDVLAHMALGRVVPDGRLEGGQMICGANGGLLTKDDDALSSIDKFELDDKSIKKVNLAKCPLEHQKFIDSYFGKIQNMRVLLDKGASDNELRSAIKDVTSLCAPKSAMGVGACVTNFSFSYQMIMNKHARALNLEAERNGGGSTVVDSDGKVLNTHGNAINSFGSPNSSSSDDGPTALRKQTTSPTDVCAGDICGSIAGGPLRTIALDGTVMDEHEQNAQIQKACDAFLLVTPPIEVEKLVEWRDSYMDELKEVYFGRQKLGIQLAALGGAMVSVGGNGGGGVDGATNNQNKSSSSEGSDSATVTTTPTTVTLAMGGVPVGGVTTTTTSGVPLIENANTSSFVREGGNVMDVLTVVERLKQSVKHEMAMKFERTHSLVLDIVQPRTAAHLASATLPLIPDPLAIATELKTRGFGGRSVKA